MGIHLCKYLLSTYCVPGCRDTLNIRKQILYIHPVITELSFWERSKHWPSPCPLTPAVWVHGPLPCCWERKLVMIRSQHRPSLNDPKLLLHVAGGLHVVGVWTDTQGSWLQTLECRQRSCGTVLRPVPLSLAAGSQLGPLLLF